MYNPATVPFDPKALVEYLNREMPRLAAELNAALAQQMVVYHSPPERPRNGLYYADGTNWDPGSGKGVYRYDESASAFVFLG